VKFFDPDTSHQLTIKLIFGSIIVTMSNAKVLNAASFEEMKQTAGYYLIDLWAEWCPPCKAMSPVIDSLSQDVDLASITFFKCDVDDQTEIADFFAVSSIPTFFLIKSKGDGSLNLATDVLKKIVGTKSPFDFKIALKSAISQ
jgi:thioredoxin 1